MNWISHIFSGALLLALPSVATILLVNIAFGVMTRTAPQINVFAVGFPITIVVGFIMILISLPTITPLLEGLLEDSFALSLTVLG
jgi:flagellar biosynthetic protein FliR